MNFNAEGCSGFPLNVFSSAPSTSDRGDRILVTSRPAVRIPQRVVVVLRTNPKETALREKENEELRGIEEKWTFYEHVIF